VIAACGKEHALMIRTIVFDLTLAVCIFCLTGCLITSSKQVKETGTPVSSNTLRQVEPGVTTTDWLLATLGPPTSRNPVDDRANTEILAYSHEVVRTSRGKVFLLFSGSSNTVDSQRTFFEVTDGVVTRFWTES
jgi:hypothetical protein